MKLRIAESAASGQELELARAGLVEIVSDEQALELLETFWNAGRSRERGITRWDVDLKQLRRGIRVEMEHTTDRQVAEKIALDHLSEFENYYRGLDWLEALLTAGLLEDSIAAVREAGIDV